MLPSGVLKIAPPPEKSYAIRFERSPQWTYTLLYDWQLNAVQMRKLDFKVHTAVNSNTKDFCSSPRSKTKAWSLNAKARNL